MRCLFISRTVADKDDSPAVTCTKCDNAYPSVTELHRHIIDYCANDGKPEEIHYGYIWVFRGRVRPKKRRKFRRSQNTPRKWMNHKRKGFLEVYDEGRNKRRRGMYELLYNPLNHIRRREMAEIVDPQSCRGCGEQFKTIAMLERHIPACMHKDRLREIHVGKSQPEDDEDSDAYDPTKHMCIYCERLFTYLGMLRNHILDVCHVRKEFIEQGELLDDEWEQDIIARAGPRETAKEAPVSSSSQLSRQSSMSSLTGLAEDAEREDEEGRSGKRGKKRKKKRSNWGYNKVKNGERRQSKNSEEGDSPACGLSLHDESSSSVGLHSESKDAESAKADTNSTEREDKAHFSAVRAVILKPDPADSEGSSKQPASNHSEDTERPDGEEAKPPAPSSPGTEKEESPSLTAAPAQDASKISSLCKQKRTLSDPKKASPAKKPKVADDVKTPAGLQVPRPKDNSAKKTPLKLPTKKAKTPVKKTPSGGNGSKSGSKSARTAKSQLEDVDVDEEEGSIDDDDDDDDDVALSIIASSPKPADSPTSTKASPTKKTGARSLKPVSNSPTKKQRGTKTVLVKTVKSPESPGKIVRGNIITRQGSPAKPAKKGGKTFTAGVRASTKGNSPLKSASKASKNSPSASGKTRLKAAAASSKTKEVASSKAKSPSVSTVKKKLKL